MNDGFVADPAPVRASWSSVRTCVRLVRKSAPRESALLVVLSIVQALAIGATLVVGGRILDLAVDDSTTTDDVWPWLVALGVLLTTSLVSAAAIRELQAVVRELLHRETVNAMLDTVVAVELEAFEEAAFYNRLARARSQLGHRVWTLVSAAVALVSASLTSLTILAVLIRVVPILVPVALLGGVPVTVVGLMNNRLYRRFYHRTTELDRDRAYHEDLLSSRDPAKDVRALDLGPFLRRRHDDLFADKIAQMRVIVRRRLGRSVLGSLVTSAVLIGTLSAAVIFAVNGDLTVGGVAIAVVGLQRLSAQLRNLADSVTTLHEAALFVGDLESFADLVPDEAIDLAPAPVSPELITMGDVHYRYPSSDRDALRGVDLTLRRGEVLALVGPNGGGKTTVAKILGGLMQPTRGAVSWDDVDLAGCSPASVRRSVASVFQDVTRFQFTARENIEIGDVDSQSESRLRRAALEAGLTDLVDGLPDGWETRLGKTFEGSEDVSIGQWQRLAVGRGFYRDSAVVILDEPSAALDPIVEAEIFDSVRRLGKDRLTIFISHRFSNVRAADAIAVLSEGRILEYGTHDDLIALGGLYADMFRLQADRFG